MVLEIGTGTGALTALLARRAAAVVTVELDPQLFHLAGEELFGSSNVTMLQADALKNKNRLNPDGAGGGRRAVGRRAGPPLQTGRQSPLQRRHARC